MTIPLGEYAQVSNKLCICYFGSSVEIINFLLFNRTHIERRYPGVEIYYSFRDEQVKHSKQDYLLESKDRIIPQGKLKTSRRKFAYIMDATRRDMDEFIEELDIVTT